MRVGIKNAQDRAVMYPNLDNDGYTEKSFATKIYNCIAWAVEDKSSFYWPVPRGARWPKDAPREVTIPAFIRMFELKGYQICDDGTHEVGHKKIAIYALDGIPKHAARQLSNGTWTSKIGSNIDIEHQTVGGLEGPFYGVVVSYMKKPI